MIKDYKKIAKQIITEIGGIENIYRLTHCMTRLRFGLNDETIPNDSKIKEIDGVLQVVRAPKEYQVVIGNDVVKVFDEIHLEEVQDQSIKINELKNENRENENKEKEENRNWFNIVSSFISGCMSPLMPAMLGGGMIKVIITLLITFNILDSNSSSAIILSSAGDAFFYFLPILLAYTAAKKAQTNPFVLMIIAGLLLHPNMTALLSHGNTTYFGLPVTASTYSSSVLPILLLVPIVKYLDRFADKYVPDIVKSFLKPMLIIFISIPIVLVVVGPLGTILGNYLADGIRFLYDTSGWIAIMILSAFMPFVVMTGMHWALLPIATLGMTKLGYDAVLIITMFAYNLAQGGSCLAVAYKNKKIRSEAMASGFSAILAGVSEPALYGITMKYKTPLYGAMIGAGISGLYAGIAHLVAYSFGASPSALSLLQMIDSKGSVNLVNGFITLVIAIISSFIASLILYKPEQEN